MQSPPFPRYLVPPRSKYSPQHHVLTHPQLPFLPQCQRPSFTPIQNNRQNYSSIYFWIATWKTKVSAPNDSKHFLCRGNMEKLIGSGLLGATKFSLCIKSLCKIKHRMFHKPGSSVQCLTQNNNKFYVRCYTENPMQRPAETWWHARRNQISSFGETNESISIGRRVRQFSRLLAAEVCASAVVMLDTPCSEVVWRVLATHCIRQFPPSLPLLCVTVCHHISTGV